VTLPVFSSALRVANTRVGGAFSAEELQFPLRVFTHSIFI
jgi:hypothetical protein